MADVAVFRIGEVPKYLRSVNTPEYEGDPDCIINPAVNSLVGVDVKYWKRVGNSIIEMTQAEKDAMTATELTQRKSAANSINVELRIVIEALISVINTKLGATKQITRDEIVSAIRSRIT